MIAGVEYGSHIHIRGAKGGEGAEQVECREP